MVANTPADQPQSMTASIVRLGQWRRETPLELPTPLTPIVGRDRELADARDLLLAPDVRLLTLTGPAGVGKTRFALALAHELQSRFSDGAAFVGLAGSERADAVVPRIARVLGVRDEGDRPLKERLFGHLRDRQILLLLDNFEQVVEAAPVVTDLLTAHPDVKVLVTSSTVLRVRGEHEFSLRPLTLPLSDMPASLDELSQVDSVALFVQRARTVRPDFTLTESNAPIIAEICRKLDGLPLAIELAAARSKVLSPTDLLERLDHRFQVLVSNSRDVPERQQTMRNAVEWGYNLLDPEEQTLLRYLSVFRGGWTLAGAEALSCDLGIDTLEVLSSLSDKSFVRQLEQANGDLRFLMLQSIRDYGLEKLAERGEEERARELHARYFESVAAEATTALIGPEASDWLERLEREHNNLRAALEWIVETGDGECGLVFGAGLWRFWETRGYMSEGQEWLEVLLTVPGADTRTEARATVLFGLGRFAYFHGQYEQARAYLEEASEVASECGSDSLVAGVVMQLGHLALVQGDHETARQYYDAGLSLRRVHDEPWGIATALLIRGRLSELQGDVSEAREYYEESLGIFREIQYDPGAARVLCQLGNLATQGARYDEAMSHYDRGLAVLREAGDREGVALALLNMGLTQRLRGEPTQAHAAIAESIGIFQDLGAPAWIAACIEVFSQLALDCGQHTLAVQMAAVASELRTGKKTPIPPVHRERTEQARVTLRQHLGNEAYVLAWEQGRLTPLDEAIATVIAGVPGTEASAEPCPDPVDEGILTRREIEILRLVADGLSNQEITQRLSISPRTTTTHISNILRKLGVNSRTAAVATARRQRLL